MIKIIFQLKKILQEFWLLNSNLYYHFWKNILDNLYSIYSYLTRFFITNYILEMSPGYNLNSKVIFYKYISNKF